MKFQLSIIFVGLTTLLFAQNQSNEARFNNRQVLSNQSNNSNNFNLVQSNVRRTNIQQRVTRNVYVPNRVANTSTIQTRSTNPQRTNTNVIQNNPTINNGNQSQERGNPNQINSFEIDNILDNNINENVIVTFGNISNNDNSQNVSQQSFVINEVNFDNNVGNVQQENVNLEIQEQVQQVNKQAKSVEITNVEVSTASIELPTISLPEINLPKLNFSKNSNASKAKKSNTTKRNKNGYYRQSGSAQFSVKKIFKKNSGHKKGGMKYLLECPKF